MKLLDKIPNLKNKTVLIIGSPSSGKTYLSELLKKIYNHKIIHTDDYIKHGFKDSLYKCMDDIIDHLKTENNEIIIEGIQGYRMLRKGIENNNFYPDILIILEVNDETINKRYLDRDKNIKGVMSMIKSNTKIMNDYMSNSINRRPEIIIIDNN